ncbi:ABC-type transport system involved in multi-copper enzyme maturation permease subunit [Paenibacillus sp. DS2015]|uniref:ABC transporter permease n=1 Tax=Paenibacillus sp. DS2015 TaxID=3373917 RepID=UPI003D200C87
MLNLMKLELKKNKLGWYYRGAAIATVVAILLMVSLEYLDGKSAFPDYGEAFSVAGVLVRATFVIMASVLIAKMIIDEYNSKTISLLFTYPISRKKIMFSKVLIVSGLTFITIIISNVVVVLGYLAFNSFLHFKASMVPTNVLIEQGISIVLQAIAAAGFSLICLYFGMRKKSVPITIVSSIIVVILLTQSINGFSISSIIAIPFSFAGIGIIIAYLSFRNIESKDIV